MSEKKRKRNGEAPTRPSKKAAALGTVKVELVENKDALGPVLAATPGLHFPAHVAFKPYQHNNHGKVPLPGHVPELLLHSSEHARLDYTAREEHDGSAESQLRDYVAVFDPATARLQLVPVKRVTVRSTLRSEAEEMREEQARLQARQNTMTAKRHALAAEFGSKKSRKAIEDMTLNAIRTANPDDPAAARNGSVADNVLANMAGSTAAMPSKHDLEAAVNSGKPRPTPNLAAEFPADVYTVDSVIGEELMTMIEVSDWVAASKAGQGVNVSSKYVAKRIVKLAKNKQIMKLKALRFILLCIEFNAALFGGGGSRPKKIPPKDKLEASMGEDTPSTQVSAIRRKFGTDANDMPRWNTDNLMTHIAAAALIVDDFEVDVNDLRDDLKIDNKEIRQYFMELGCRVTAPTEADRTKYKLTKADANNHHIAKLKLPLVFPRIGGPRKSRK